MIFRIRRIAAGVIAGVLIMANAVGAQEKTGTASVSGKVTVKNKGVAGIVVLASEQSPRPWSRSTYRATTDQTGTYRITNLPAGTYAVGPITPTFAFEDERFNSSVVLNEGETVEDINFSMLPGGVITGKITDA